MGLFEDVFNPVTSSVNSLTGGLGSALNLGGMFDNLMGKPDYDPALAAQYPEIKSYIGIGIDNPTATVYFSISPLGFKAMTLIADKSAVFIEPFSQDLTVYSVYKKSDKIASLSPFLFCI